MTFPARAFLLAAAMAMTHAAAALARELPVAAPEAVGLSSAKLAAVDAVVNKLIAEKKLAGAVVVVLRHNQIAYEKAFGALDLKASKPMRTDAVFRIYSMSKAVVTAAALTLYDDGRLDLDAPVSKFIPEFAHPKVWTAAGMVPARREPTVRDLMRHTAGLSYGQGDDPVNKGYRENHVFSNDIDLKSMGERLGAQPLNYEPGTRWLYSYSVDVLGRVVEVVSGERLDAFLQRRILGPLDLHDTGFSVPYASVERFAACYASDGKGHLSLEEAPTTSRYLKPPVMLSGGGGLVSTARDYTRFLAMIAGGGTLDGVRILKRRTVGLMTHNALDPEILPISFGAEKRDGMGFGLGFNVRVAQSATWDPASRVGEYGWGGAASTHYWASPKDDLTVVTMEQTFPFNLNLEFAVKGLIYDAIVK